MIVQIISLMMQVTSGPRIYSSRQCLSCVVRLAVSGVGVELLPEWLSRTFESLNSRWLGCGIKHHELDLVVAALARVNQDTIVEGKGPQLMRILDRQFVDE